MMRNFIKIARRMSLRGAKRRSNLLRLLRPTASQRLRRIASLISFARNDICRLFLFLSIVFSFWSICYADETVSSAELINNAKQYDGKTVIYKGEVIGDIMARGEFAWINVNDGVNAIGIWSNKDLVKDIIYTGSYKSIGDTVEVKGVFHRACLEHGGDLDIHIEELRKINNGMIIQERVDVAKKKAVFVLLAALCIVMILSITWGKK